MLLSGGVGGARLARGLTAVLPPQRLTVVVNVGDDDDVYGVRVCADLDTVLYTLAGCEGPHGWGIAGDTFARIAALEAAGADTWFRLGDRDWEHCERRTEALAAGVPLSKATADLAARLAVAHPVLPASDDPVRTRVRTRDGWLGFQDYFVRRGHRDPVEEVEFAGADAARPAPGVLEALAAADVVVVAPSNPPLSIWPILAVPGVREAAAAAPRVVAVSPLFGGRALKGPAAGVMASLGLPGGNAGVAAAYDGLISELVVDRADQDQPVAGLRFWATDTRIAEPAAAARFARELLEPR